MIPMRRDLHISFRFAALLALYVVFAIHAHAQESADKAKVWSSSEMKWQDDKALPGVQTVPLWGNPASGEHGMLRKFPAGYAPAHAQASLGGAGCCHLGNNRSPV